KCHLRPLPFSRHYFDEVARLSSVLAQDLSAPVAKSPGQRTATSVRQRNSRHGYTIGAVQRALLFAPKLRLLFRKFLSRASWVGLQARPVSYHRSFQATHWQ